MRVAYRKALLPEGRRGRKACLREKGAPVSEGRRRRKPSAAGVLRPRPPDCRGRRGRPCRGLSPPWGNFEKWSNKTEEIRNKDVEASQLINFEKSYVENEKGEKFYSSKSSYAGTGLTTDGYLRFWNTFDLTQYDMTDKLKVVLITIDGNEITIELKKY